MTKCRCNHKRNKVRLAARLAVAICLWGCFLTHPANACQYNVRDIGFVDLGTKQYHLYGYVSQDSPADITSSFTQISYAALMDSNIKVEVINIDRQKDHPAMKYLDLWRSGSQTQNIASGLASIQSLPAAVLVSPDGQSLPVPITKPDQPFKQTLQSALDYILSSPKRAEILDQVSKAYAVILLIEGAETQENKKAHQAACRAIERISRQMEMMPKPIAHPPVLVVIESQSIAREKILLWSLSLDADKESKPCAAVLYGKARWLGPLLKGEEINEAVLTNILYVIGEDCECGLDRRWMQGTMLPARWDEKIQARLPKTLGFDPENPMVKMEVSRILKLGSAYPGVPFGYQELTVEFEPASEIEQAPSKQAQNIRTPEPATAEPISQPPILADTYSSLRICVLILIGLACLVLIAGIAILLRAKRR